MTFVLPRAVAKTSGIELQVIDYAVDEGQARADSTGTATYQYPQIQPGYLWRVERVVISTTSSNILQASVFGGDVNSAVQFRDGTAIYPGTAAVAEYPSYLTILGGRQLGIVVTGCATGDEVTVSAQYQVVSKRAVDG